MADRYWRGGTDNWNGVVGTKWAATVGGAGGASIPTSADDVFFDATSGVNTVTISAGNTGAKSITCTGFTGTLAGSAAITVSGSVTLVTGMTFSNTSIFTIAGTGAITSAGKTFSQIIVNGAGITVTLADAVINTNAFTVTAGTFTTNNFGLTAISLASSNSNVRSINLGSSTLTLSGGGSIGFGTSTNLTFNAGTSTITCSNTSPVFAGGGQTFNNVTFSSTALALPSMTGANTFANFTITGRSGSGFGILDFSANQTITGTLTVSAGGGAGARIFLNSSTENTVCTLTCAAVSLTDVDFRDITIAGAAAPASGTRLGDAKGNSGITFPAGVPKYWANTAAGSWGSITTAYWSTTAGGTPAINDFPLPQDTATIQNTYPTSGTISVGSSYNIGSINMSARTGGVTLAFSTTSPNIYGNWANGSGVTLSGTGTITFNGRGDTQTITSAAKTFTNLITVANFGGTVRLLDAFVCSAATFTLTTGTFDANGFNVTLSSGAAAFSSSNSNTRTVAIGSGTWSNAGSGIAWDCATSTNLTVTGTGTLSFTSSGIKTFAGGGIQTYPTINQNGAGTLTISGSNKFADIINNYAFTGATTVTFTAGTSNIFTAFNLSGISTGICTLQASSATKATLRKGSTWYMGVNSTNGGGNTGLIFADGATIDYLNVINITGVSTVGVVDEAASGLDTVVGAMVISGAVDEAASGLEDVAGIRSIPGIIDEAASALEFISVIGTYNLAVSEAASGLDDIEGGFSYASAILEAASALEDLIGGKSYDSAIIESATGVDILTGLLFWEPIDDQQTPDWTTIGTTQSPVWTDITNTQTPGWTDIPTS